MRFGLLLLCLLALGDSLSSAQFQLDFPLAPAPAPAALAPVLAEQPERPEVAAPIKPVSTPILTTLEPIVTDVMATAKTIAQDVRSEVDGFKTAVSGMDSLQGRKLLTETKKNRLSSQSTPSLKRLQAQPDQQIGKAQAVATAANSHQQIIDTIGSQAAQADENARIERELAKMKEDRLKAIQALPSSVWH